MDEELKAKLAEMGGNGCLKKEDPSHCPTFAVIDPVFLMDTRLSWKAKGVLAYFMSKVYEPFDISYQELLIISSDDEQTLQQGIEELIQFGYMTNDCIDRLRKQS